MTYGSEQKNHTGILFTLGGGAVFLVLTLIAAAMVGCPAYNRYQTNLDNNLARTQARMNAENQTQINATVIQQTEQLVQVEKQKAQIRIVEAGGIAQAQQIINATLTDRYLQHEAIGVQEKVAASANHSDTFYIPAGQNGIPLVKTLDTPAQTGGK